MTGGGLFQAVVTNPKLNGFEVLKSINPQGDFDLHLKADRFQVPGKGEKTTLPYHGENHLSTETQKFALKNKTLSYEGAGLSVDADTITLNKAGIHVPNGTLELNADETLRLFKASLKAQGIDLTATHYRDTASKVISGIYGTSVTADDIRINAHKTTSGLPGNTTEHAQTSIYKTTGDLSFEASNYILMTGPDLIVPQGALTLDSSNTKIQGLWLIDKKTLVEMDEGWLSDTTTVTQMEHARHKFASLVASNIEVKGGKALFKGASLNAQTLVDESEKGMRLVPNVTQTAYRQVRTTDTPLSFQEVGVQGGQEVMAKTKLNVQTVERDPNLPPMRLQSVQWDPSKIDILGPYRESVYHLKSWQTTWAKSEQVIPNEALLVIALAASIATYGACGGLVSALGITSEMGIAMAKAGFATLASQTTASFGRSGDPLQAVQAPFQKDNLQSLAINVAAAGLMAKFGPPSTKDLLAAKKTPVFSDFVRYNAARSAFTTGLNMAITGKPLERALKDGALQFAGNTLGGYGSYQIGQSYGPVNLEGTPKESGLFYGEHKLLHGVVGGLTGGILNASKSSKEIKQGVISGATGAMAAEIAGEEILKHKLVNAVEEDIRKTGQIPSQQRIADLSVQAAKDTKPWANVIGSSTGAFIGKDANTAYWASDNALENNMQVIGPVLEALSLAPRVAQLLSKVDPKTVVQLVQKGASLATLLDVFNKKSNEKADQIAKQEAGKQAPSTTGGPGLEPEKDPKKEGGEERRTKV